MPLRACCSPRRCTAPGRCSKATPTTENDLSAMHDYIYLASQSPRRAQLLGQLGIEHRLLLADAEEDAESLEAERRGEAPADYVRRVTLAKLRAARRRLVQRQLPMAPILAADTTVALGKRIVGKPRDAA